MQTTQNSNSQFKLFQKFHFFYYSYKDGQPYFLLRKKKSGLYSEIRGHLEPHDPAIMFSVGRKIMEISSGLLTQQNLQFFTEENAFPNDNMDMIQYCRPRQQMPSLLNSKLFQKFIEETFETMETYQEANNNDAYFFVQIPYVNLDKLRTCAEAKSISMELAYISRADILSSAPSVPIHQSLMALFTPELNSYVERFIEKGEPIPITARYAAVCILTTPTNYRTMGLLGSYFKKHGEHWKFYRFPVEEPSEKELSQLDGLLIPGATVCAADKSLVWREKLLKLIRTVYEDYNSCKIMGTCFGIQIISEALEGKIERMKEPVRGTTNLKVSSSFWELPYVKELGVETTENLVIAKAHFDAVVEAPKMATIYASSDVSAVEIMGFGDRVLAFQGHPEINEPWTACLVYQAYQEKMNFNIYCEEINKKFFKEKLRHEMWLKIMYSFFKRKSI